VTERVVFTIGYQGKSIDSLVDVLRSEDVELLVDVRLNAMSRKPGFSRRRLADALAAGGIEYLHEPRLGNPTDNRPGFAAGDPASHEFYRVRLHAEARSAYEEVVRLAAERPVALLCYEADHRTCHRTCITERMRTDDPELRVVDL
jgi:uncharacterized protein (DUF488 family)